MLLLLLHAVLLYGASVNCAGVDIGARAGVGAAHGRFDLPARPVCETNVWCADGIEPRLHEVQLVLRTRWRCYGGACHCALEIVHSKCFFHAFTALDAVYTWLQPGAYASSGCTPPAAQQYTRLPALVSAA